MINIKTFNSKIYPDLIERIWLLENISDELEVLSPPDPYINLIIPIAGSTWNSNGEIFNSIQVEGINLQTNINNYPPNSKLLGIRFYPYGLSAFSNINGKSLLDKTIAIQNVFKHFKLATDDFNSEKIDLIIKKIDAFLKQNFNPKWYDKHQRLRFFYQYYRMDHGMGNIEDFSKQFATNYSTLNRHFSKTIGLSSKQFERRIKFRKALCSLTDSKDKLSAIGIDSGYFDQSHFIREFKLFMNSSPTAYHALIRKADEESQIINYNFRIL